MPEPELSELAIHHLHERNLELADQIHRRIVMAAEASGIPHPASRFFVREAANGGHYLKKPCSRFSGKEGNLPLDLWDSTPDP